MSNLINVLNNASQGQVRTVEIMKEYGCDVSQALDILMRERAAERREFDKEVQAANREARANGTHEPTSSDLALFLANECGVPLPDALSAAVRMARQGWVEHSPGTVMMRAALKRGRPVAEAFDIALSQLGGE